MISSVKKVEARDRHARGSREAIERRRRESASISFSKTTKEETELDNDT